MQMKGQNPRRPTPINSCRLVLWRDNDFQLRLYQKPFISRVPTGYAGELTALPRSPDLDWKGALEMMEGHKGKGRRCGRAENGKKMGKKSTEEKEGRGNDEQRRGEKKWKWNERTNLHFTPPNLKFYIPLLNMWQMIVNYCGQNFPNAVRHLVGNQRSGLGTDLWDRPVRLRIRPLIIFNELSDWQRIEI